MINNGINDDFIICPKCRKKRNHNIKECPWCKAAEILKYVEVVHEEYDIEDDSALFNYEQGDEQWVTVDTDKTFLLELSPDWQIQGKEQLLSSKQEEMLYGFLGDLNLIKRCAPAVFKVVETMAHEEHVFVAKLDDYYKKKIADGTLRFCIDKSGEILPAVRDKQHIVKQVRLEEMTLNNGVNFSELTGNIYTQLMLSKILDEVRVLNQSVKSLKEDLQEDRYAMADSAIREYKQALAIVGPRRAIFMQSAALSATKAKSTLMRNLNKRLKDISEKIHRRWSDRIMDVKGEKQLIEASEDALMDLVKIVQMVDIECTVHRYYGDNEAINVCLEDFISFISGNKLDQRDTLLKIVVCVPSKCDDFIGSIAKLITNIYLYQSGMQLEDTIANQKLLKSLTPKIVKFCKSCGKELPGDCKAEKCEFCNRQSDKALREGAGALAAGAGAGFFGAGIIGKPIK